MPPVSKLALQHLAGQPFALPPGKITVLHWQFRQRRRIPDRVGAIERGQLVEQDIAGPRIRDDMMHGQQQHMSIVAQRDQSGAQQRTGAEIKGKLGFLLDKLGTSGCTADGHRGVDCSNRPGQKTQFSCVCLANAAKSKELAGSSLTPLTMRLEWPVRGSQRTSTSQRTG